MKPKSMIEVPGFFGSVNLEIKWWKDKAHELDQKCDQLARDKAENDAIGYKMDADKLAARVEELETIMSAAMRKCRQYWNEPDIDAPETHAVLEWIHDTLVATLRPTEEKKP